MARTQPPDIEHHRLAFEARAELGHHGIDQRLILGNHRFRIGLDLRTEIFGNLAQRGGDLRGAEEIVLRPGNAVFLFHVAADVIHRPVAVDEVELGLRRPLDFGQRGIARPVADHAQAISSSRMREAQASPPIL